MYLFQNSLKKITFAVENFQNKYFTDQNGKEK